MDLHGTQSEHELNVQAQLALLDLSPRNKQNQLSVSGYLAAMTTSFEEDSHQSRCPTSKDCGEIIKRLRNENWDLKCRYVTEKIGRTTSSNGLTTLTASNIQDLVREVQSLKESKEAAEQRFTELERENQDLQVSIIRGQERETLLQHRNDELVHKINILDHELQLANMRVRDDFESLDDPGVPERESLSAEPSHETEPEQLRDLQQKIRQLEWSLDVATEEVTTKAQLIESLANLLKEKNELVDNTTQENMRFKDNIVNMTQAFKELGYRHTDEVTLHNSLKQRYKELLDEYEQVRASLEQMKVEFENLAAIKSHQDQQVSANLSADLSIDPGHNAVRMQNALKSPKDNSSEEQIHQLKAMNKELIHKLRQTRAAFEESMRRLTTTTQQKDQVEIAICRQLHRTHDILKEARKKLQNPTDPDSVPCDQKGCSPIP